MAVEKTNIPPVKRFSVLAYDRAHYQKVEAFVSLVDRQYEMAIRAFATIAAKTNIDPDRPFSFDDYPLIKRSAIKIIDDLNAGVKTIIEKGSREEWLYACKKNDAFLHTILDFSKVPKETLSGWQDRNLDALEAFQKRKANGFDLSQRIWKYSQQLKSTMELAIDVGIGEGRSAQELSRDIRQNLIDPDNLFRRVRNKRGNLRLSKLAKAFHPGQGVYRSSYKNAMRLTRSEINMAYATSDQLRWQALDFVVGFEVKRSNHEYDCDVCEQLKGRYPKSFNWRKWHPQCRCFAVPILMRYEDFNNDELNELRAAFKGTEYKKFVPDNTVTDVPEGFKKWVADNKGNSENWTSTPYFVKDNFIDGSLKKGLKPGISTKGSKTRIKKKAAAAETSSDQVKARIHKVEDRIRKNKSFETAVVFDDDGNIIFQKKGQSRSVAFTPEEVELFKDRIFTHNHPTGWKSPEGTIGRIGSSFSKPDVYVSIKNDVKEMRAVTPMIRFSMKRPEKGWPNITEARYRMQEIEEEIIYDFLQRIRKGILTQKQAQILTPHLLWKQFAKEYGIKYTKEAI